MKTKNITTSNENNNCTVELQEMLNELFKREERVKNVEHDRIELFDMIDNYNN